MRVILIVIIALTLAGCGDSDGVPVVGTLERDRITLTAEQTEPITAINVHEGQAVAAGDRLLSLDAERTEAALDQAQARRDQAQARLDELLRGPRDESIREARARLAAAESAVATRTRELERARQLNERGLLSDSERDAALSRRDDAIGQRDAARAALEAMLEGTTVEALDQARAALAEAQAGVRQQRRNLRGLTLTSPRGAVVESLPFEIGETPSRGQAVVTLRATDQPPYANVYIPAALRHQTQPGDSLTVQIEGHGTFTGTVRYLASEAAFTPYYALTEQETGRLSYRAEIDLPEAGDLPSGIPVRALLKTTDE